MIKINIESAKEMFVAYVASFEDRERHTDMACEEVKRYDAFCDKVFKDDYKLNCKLSEMMMDVAVEFEESGFIAGVQYATHFLADTIKETGNSYSEVESKDICKYITTHQIAEIFNTGNFRVVKKIEKSILPKLDDSSKKNFVKSTIFNSKNKKIEIYKLNRIACEEYMRSIKQNKKCYIKVAAGYSKLEEFVEHYFNEAEKL